MKTKSLSIAVLLVGALLLAACSSKATPAPVVPEGTHAGDLTGMKACEFQPEGSKTKYGAECGTLSVPERWGNPAARLIALPVTRLHATGKAAAEPIFWLTGGPGHSNMAFEPPAALLARHDVVLVGYRGVDGSARLDCPEVNQAMHGAGGDLLSEASRAGMGAAAQACAERLQAAGVDLAGYTMPGVVADLEAARTALGYERVNLLSESYGTRLAQIYAALHPDRLYRSAMLGVNPPGRMVWEPATIDAQLRYYARLCAQDTGCSARTADLAETMRTVAHNLPKRWLFIPIDPGKVKAGTFALLFHRGTAASVFDAYLAAQRGDASGLAMMSLVADLALPTIGGAWGDFLSKGGSADFDPARNYTADMDPPDSILGSPLSLLYYGRVLGNWPMELIPAELRQAQPSSVETLLVSGSVDFSTPAELATQELLPHLSKGKQVILAEMGHTDDLWHLQPAATEHLLAGFYDTGVADDSLYTKAPMDFRVSMGFPVLAKLALGIVVLLMAVLGLVVYLIVRRISRRARGTKALPMPVSA